MNKEDFLTACRTGNLPTTVALPIDVNAVEKEDGNTGLMIAAREGHLEIVKHLMKEYPDIDVNINNKFGYNALMFAAQNGHLDIISLLLENDKVDIEMTNKAGRKAEHCAKKKVKESVQAMINQTRIRRKGGLANIANTSPFDGSPIGHKRKILDDVHDGIPQKIVRPNQHLPNLPSTSEESEVKLEIKKEDEADEKTTSEIALALMKNGNNLAVNVIPPRPRSSGSRESDREKIGGRIPDKRASDTESIRSSKDESASESANAKPDVKDILTARFENCLIDMGGAKENVCLAKEVFHLARNLGLVDLQVICRRILIENLSMNTIFDLVEIFSQLQGDKESEEMLNICKNFIVANIDDLRVLAEWKPFLRQQPELAIELIDRL